MPSLCGVQVGIDTGCLFTEVVIADQTGVLAWSVHPTSYDIQTGLTRALTDALEVGKETTGQETKEICHSIKGFKLGISDLTRVVEERRQLTRVAVIRLCGPTTQGLPPFSDIPSALTQIIVGPVYMVDGGFSLDGENVVRPLNQVGICRIVDEIHEKGVSNIVVCGVFSQKNNSQEKQVRQWITEKYPDMSITMSHDMDSMSLLQRENAAILNETLKSIITERLKAVKELLGNINRCPCQVVLNDGTLVTPEEVERFPIRTFGTSTASCMRAASLLTGVQDGIVLDICKEKIIGGNIKNSQPGFVHSKVKIGGILTSIARPDVLSFPFNQLQNHGESGKNWEGPSTEASMEGISSQYIADLVDQTKSSQEDVPLLLVGLGASSVDVSQCIKGTTSMLVSPNSQVIHAMGALLAISAGEQPDVSCFKNDKWGVCQNKENQSFSNLMNEMEASHDSTMGNISGSSRSHLDTRNPPDVCIDEATGEWILSEYDVECIAIGAGILGCGGGGNPYLGKLAALQQIRSGKKIRVISADRFRRQASPEDYAFPVASMGAPTAQAERLTDPFRLRAAVEALADLYAVPGYTDDKPFECSDFGDGNKVLNEGGNHYIEDFKARDGPKFINDFGDGNKVLNEGGNHYIEDFKARDGPKFINGKKNIAAVFAVEIGGSNSMEPFLLASEIDVPVIDCDCMGRALPEIQMFSQYIHGSNWFPAAVGDSDGRKCVCLHAETPKHLEDFCRKSCIEMGSLASFCGRPVSPEELVGKTILHSTSRAWRLGQQVFAAKRIKTCPVSAILESQQGKLICSAKISEVKRHTTGGFTWGEIILQGRGEFTSQTFSILIHNENLIAQEILEDGKTKTLATVPDLISIVDVEHGESVPTEEIKYGLRVAVLALPAPNLLSTPEALKVVGPQVFGYEGIEYHPVGVYSTHDSVLPQ